MKYMLDTNIISYLMKNQPKSIAEKIAQLPADTSLIMSFVTYAELLKGAENSQQKAFVLQKLAKMTEIIQVVYPNDDKICQHYAVQFLQLKALAKQIGNNDLWIACHALAENAVVVTNNVREFQRIDGLILENWVA